MKHDWGFIAAIEELLVDYVDKHRDEGDGNHVASDA